VRQWDTDGARRYATAPASGMVWKLDVKDCFDVAVASCMKVGSAGWVDIGWLVVLWLWQ
jgi:hypothetical protein